MANPSTAPILFDPGLIARSTAAPERSEEIQLQIDPMHGDLDESITGLRGQIRRLKGVAQEIETEAQFQKDFISKLQMTLIKAQAGLKNNIRKMNRRIIQQGSNHVVVHVALFALLCFFAVYLWSKFHST
uniref:Bet1-like protein At4g14600 n=1 Tax=Ananas comosus var. bracteatus TaxID=296719 RepID=A0A6V7Q530_ANACO|nr:unnamed protein product [Ananas comosus var. bracteatus]